MFEQEVSLITEKKHRPLIKPIVQWAGILGATAALGIGGFVVWKQVSSQTGVENQTGIHTPLPQAQKVVETITALGRLEPHGEVIQVSAPTFLEGARVEKLLVEDTDWVKSGQVIAVLDRRERLQAALKQAQRQVEVAQARLAKVKAGAKKGDLGAQKATIARLEAELRIAQTEHQRYKYLQETGAISASLLDSKRQIVETIQGQLNQAKSTLTSIAEVRPTDIQEAEAEIASAVASEQKAKADLETAFVTAPQNGQVLKIHTRAGEMVGAKAIADIGQTRQMDVIAEVYENDLAKVKIGQKATITSLNKAFVGKLQGTVYRIIPQIGKRDVLNDDPAAAVDARVAEVKISLLPKDSQRIMSLINLKVEVAINP
ncbi:MAG: ABC exporter membrane fusion protein [Nostoc sp.]|uniref:ABC exporter membrane fusion protein n=1 Tax=Nostoc sp. TaxID=1180 RepID=UPI002FF60272